MLDSISVSLSKPNPATHGDAMTLRVGIVAHSALGGSGVVADQLAHQLVEHGHIVHVVRTNASPRPGADRRGLFEHQIDPPNHPVFDGPPWTIAMASELARVIDEARLDVLHVHYAVPYAVSAWLAIEMADRTPRLVVTLHGSDVTGVGASPAYAPTIAAALKRATSITTPSWALASQAREVMGFPDDQHIDVISNFVDASIFSPDGERALNSDRKRIVHVSNFRDVKRTHLLIDLLEAVRETVDAELLLIGDGPNHDYVLGLAESRNLKPYVRAIGTVMAPTPYLRSSDVFVLPSAQESFGLAALEAMACGVPVVASRVGGLPEVVSDEETGYLVDPDVNHAFTDRVLALLTDDALRASFSENARMRAVERFSPERALRAYLRVYTRD